MVDDDRARSADRRGEVLNELKADGASVTIADLASRLDVHPNTVRFHLEKLVAAGRVEVALQDRGGPGRPPQRFRVVPGMDPAGPRRYHLLAEILVRELSENPNAAARAESAGRAWGSRLAGQNGADSPVGRLVSLLDQLGFAPAPPEVANPSTIALTSCPFLELVEIGPGLVCQVHLGLMRGAFSASSSTVNVDRLEPFATPDRCLAHLTRIGGAAA